MNTGRTAHFCSSNILITWPIFTSSLGQISGQYVNPKYKSNHSPSKSLFVHGLPSLSTSDHGPPSAGLPITVSFEATANKQEV